MKKIMKLFVYVAAAAMALASCQKNEIDGPVNDGVQFTINAGIAETKTVITDNGNGTYTPSWDGTESLAVLFELPKKETEAKDATKFTNQTGKGTTAKFSATVTNIPDNGTLYAVSPYDAFGRGFEGGIARLDLNHEQKPTATSFDPACDILVAKPYDYAVVDGAVEVDPLYFTRIMSVLKVNLKSDFDGVKNENVESIKFSTGGVEITGYAKVSLENPAFAGEWTTKYDYVTATYESETISVNGENNSVYFVVAPVTIPVEKELTFTIKTTNYSITKTVKEHPEMTFSAGNVSVINLNIKEDECTSLSGGDDADRYYEKVTSAPADWSGKYLIVYEGTPAYLDGSLTPGKSSGQIGSTAGMISTTIISNDKIKSSEEVDKSIVTIEKSGTGYALKASSGKYMGMSGNDNGMKNSDNASDYVHTISLNTDNSVTLLSSDGNTKLAYNKNSGYFRYYKVTTINGQPSLYPLPVLYRLVDTNEGGGETPEPEQKYLTVSQSVFNVTADQTSVTFDVNANVGWGLDESEGVETHIVDVSDDELVMTVEVTFPANETAEPKTHTVTFIPEELDETVTVTINQAAKVEVDDSFEPGEYWIVANEKYAMPLTGNYGYLQVDAAGYTDNVFTISAVDGGYTIKQPDGKYLYMTEEYDSFNVSAAPSEGHVWAIAQNGDGSYKILNVLKSKYVQLDSEYGTYGSYTAEKGTMPNLVPADAATARPVFSVTSASKNVACDVTEASFEIVSNQNWTIVPGEGVTVNVTSGSGNGIITMTFAENKSEEDVSYTAIVKADGLEDIVLTVVQSGIPTGDVTETVVDLTWTLGSNAYDGTTTSQKQTATINGVNYSNLLKLGTKSASGSASIKLPAGTTKVTYSAVAWKGASCTLKFTVGGTAHTQKISANNGATGNPKYTIISTPADNYELVVSVDQETTMTVTTTKAVRAILWDLKAVVVN